MYIKYLPNNYLTVKRENFNYVVSTTKISTLGYLVSIKYYCYFKLCSNKLENGATYLNYIEAILITYFIL